MSPAQALSVINPLSVQPATSAQWDDLKMALNAAGMPLLADRARAMANEYMSAWLAADTTQASANGLQLQNEIRAALNGAPAARTTTTQFGDDMGYYGSDITTAAIANGMVQALFGTPAASLGSWIKKGLGVATAIIPGQLDNLLVDAALGALGGGGGNAMAQPTGGSLPPGAADLLGQGAAAIGQATGNPNTVNITNTTDVNLPAPVLPGGGFLPTMTKPYMEQRFKAPKGYVIVTIPAHDPAAPQVLARGAFRPRRGSRSPFRKTMPAAPACGSRAGSRF